MSSVGSKEDRPGCLLMKCFAVHQTGRPESRAKHASLWKCIHNTLAYILNSQHARTHAHTHTRTHTHTGSCCNRLVLLRLLQCPLRQWGEREGRQRENTEEDELDLYDVLVRRGWGHVGTYESVMNPDYVCVCVCVSVDVWAVSWRKVITRGGNWYTWPHAPSLFPSIYPSIHLYISAWHKDSITGKRKDSVCTLVRKKSADKLEYLHSTLTKTDARKLCTWRFSDGSHTQTHIYFGRYNHVITRRIGLAFHACRCRNMADLEEEDSAPSSAIRTHSKVT